jgi:hypothetical protein
LSCPPGLKKTFTESTESNVTLQLQREARPWCRGLSSHRRRYRKAYSPLDSATTRSASVCVCFQSTRAVRRFVVKLLWSALNSYGKRSERTPYCSRRLLQRTDRRCRRTFSTVLRPRCGDRASSIPLPLGWRQRGFRGRRLRRGAATDLFEGLLSEIRKCHSQVLNPALTPCYQTRHLQFGPLPPTYFPLNVCSFAARTPSRIRRCTVRPSWCCP